MTWAPCLLASWAACSCFWIIDSLSPVQLAWRSAPRTMRGMSDPHLIVTMQSEEGEGTTTDRAPNDARSWMAPLTCGLRRAVAAEGTPRRIATRVGRTSPIARANPSRETIDDE